MKEERLLAYVFWHWPRNGVSPDEYELLQRRFHTALREGPPVGFLGSRSHAIAEVPWIDRGPAYEDWYLLENASALDPLNEAAITASRRIPHDAAAAAAAGGTAGLYRRRLGGKDRAAPVVAAWFSKPNGMSYADLDGALEPLLSRGDVLWCRQMVLGPTPEFCLQSPVPVTLPAIFAPLVVPLRGVWPTGTR
jgi:hypothetical protein